MTERQRVYRRIVRRETHSPKSALAILVALVVAAAAVLAGIEAVLAMAGQRALLVAPVDAQRAITGLGSDQTALVIAGGAVLALIGLVLVIAGLTPSRRPRHTLPSERSAVVVDNEVIASSLAREASYAGNLDPDSTSVAVSHRRAVVTVRPTSGQAVDRDAVKSAVDARLASFELTPTVTSRVRVLADGKVGG